jgi:hypothetical protein
LVIFPIFYQVVGLVNFMLVQKMKKSLHLPYVVMIYLVHRLKRHST